MFEEHAGSKAARGLYTPVRPGLLSCVSQDVVHCAVHGDSNGYSPNPPEFDHLIYLDGNACRDEIGLTLTLAHELQHFIQHCNSADPWAANKMISTLCKLLCDSEVAALNMKSFQVPVEEEARIVAKRTAENIFGPGMVAAYIATKVSEARARCDENDAEDWSFVLSLPVLGGLGAELPDTTTLYDLASNTKRIYRQTLSNHRSQLTSVLQAFKVDPAYDVDFQNLDLGAFFEGSVS